MKNLFLIFVLISSLSFAQTGINYQGAATDADGAKLVNQNISLKTSVLQGGVDGTTSYSEIHNTTTDQFGLFNVVIGQGVSISGDFETISWGSGDHFLKVELDATGGTNYNLVSTTQMMSVPYALYAKNAGLDSAAVSDMLASMNISGNSGSTFNLNFPQGYNGEVILHDFYADGSYQVPANKILYISYLYTFSQEEIKIDNNEITNTYLGSTYGSASSPSINNPIVANEGQTISYNGTYASFHGILIENIDQIDPITHNLYTNFTVPNGKKLIINNVLFNSDQQQIFIDNVPTFKGFWLHKVGNHSGNILGQPIIVDAGKVINSSNNSGTFNGYLVDEDYFVDYSGGGGNFSSAPSSIDSSMVADMIAANTSSGSGGDWELLYDELNTNNDEPYGTVNRYGIAQSDGFLYLVGSSAVVYTGNDHDTITNTWPENPILQNISANDPNEAHIIPLKEEYVLAP